MAAGFSAWMTARVSRADAGKTALMQQWLQQQMDLSLSSYKAGLRVKGTIHETQGPPLLVLEDGSCVHDAAFLLASGFPFLSYEDERQG
jgi:hypothetical protein